ncbi:MAG: CoA activase [Candidatus Dadabacteria bacterium]|nr:MAG: CoA activase [Candidatus Dadabacteria bacterium]
MITAGIDIGSRTIKVAVLRDGEIVGRALDTAGAEPARRASALLRDALLAAGVSRDAVAHITATGAGRALVEDAHSTVTDITAAARAANFFFPGAVTVVEVGAEESRAVKTDGAGRVLDSAVNEKCAAGSGSFTESMARALGMTLEEFAEKSLQSTTRIAMNAQCTVFAESEVVGLMHSGVDRRDIAYAVNDAIATRVSATARRVKLEGEVVLLGGLARNRGFVRCLKEKLEVDRILIPEAPELADAVGAAIVAAERAA